MIRNKEIIKMTVIEIKCKLSFLENISVKNQKITELTENAQNIILEIENILKEG